MNKLLSEFKPLNAKAWKQKIQVDLKGAPYQDLVWNTNEGIDVKPFYNSEDRQIPTNFKASTAKICQSFIVENEQTTNAQMQNAIKNGVNSLLVIAHKPFDIASLFFGINQTEIQLQCTFLDADFFQKVQAYFSTEKLFLNIDVIGNLAKTGNWFQSLNDDHKAVEQIVKNSTENTTVLAVNTSVYQNAGASITQQITYALAHTNEYLNHFGGDIANNIQYHFAVGSNYFFEIAKIRAFKLCLESLLKAYNVTSEPQIFVQPTNRNKTLYDYNVNMLRTTTECMSAILGGATTVCNNAYDAIYHFKNDFGERIAKNQLLVLQEESYFKEASNIANGAFYIESLTAQLGENALALFKDIEKNGGFLKQLKNGTIQRKIKESAEKEQAQFDANELILVGTNKYSNVKDKMKDDLQINPFVVKNEQKTLLRPILPKRLSAKLEQERLENE